MINGINSNLHRKKIIYKLWGLVYYTLYRFSPRCLWGWRKFLLSIFGAKIGENCKFSPKAKIINPWNFECGNFVAIANNATIHCYGKIYIKTKVAISSGSLLYSLTININNNKFICTASPINIESFVWIATDAYIGPGVTIGEGAVVGARACVFKDVEPWSVVGGNPAVFLKKRVIVKK